MGLIFHLSHDGFWHLVPVPGQEQALAAVRQISRLSQLQQDVQGASVRA